MSLCPICRKRPQDSSTRIDAKGEHWCKECLDEFDSIDWDEIADRRL